MKASNRARFAFILPWSITHTGGVNEVVRCLMRECSRNGAYDPILVENCWEAPVLVEKNTSGVKNVSLRMRSPWEEGRSLRAFVAWLLFLPLTVIRLRQLTRRYNIQVLNAHFPDLYCLNLILLKRLFLFRGSIILSFHGSDIRGAYSLGAWPRWLWKRMLRNADFLVSCSADLGGEITAFDPSCQERLRVIHNGVDVEAFHAEADSNFVLPGELAEKRVILSIGAFLYWKAHDVLLRAFASLQGNHRDLVLLVIGARRTEFERTQALVRELGLSDKVFLLTNIPHNRIPVYLGYARVFVLPSRWQPGVFGEGFPVAVLEAAAAGVPVVAAATCGVGELVEDGISGRMVACEDVVALAAAICEVLENPERARRWNVNLQERVRESFTWSRALQQYLRLSPAVHPEGLGAGAKDVL